MTTQLIRTVYDEAGERKLMGYDLPEGHTADLRANSIGYELVESWLETNEQHKALNTVMERAVVRTVFFDAQFREVGSITKVNDWVTKIDNSSNKGKGKGNIILPIDYKN